MKQKKIKIRNFPSNPKKINFSCRLPEDLLYIIDKYGEVYSTNRSKIIQEALEKFFKISE